MTRAVTAIYRTHAVANLVRQELEALGVDRNDIHLVPDDDKEFRAGSRDDDHSWNDSLHGLHLPEHDLRTYQNAVRNGDFVVSVDLDGDVDLDRIKDVMRRPEDEAYDIGAMDTMYEGAAYTPRTGQTAYAPDERYLANRDDMADGDDAYVRSYTRQNRYTYEDRARDGGTDGTLYGDRAEGTIKSA